MLTAFVAIAALLVNQPGSTPAQPEASRPATEATPPDRDPMPIEEAGRWITYAYLLDQPELAGDALLALARAGVLETPEAERNIAVHLGFFMRERPGLRARLIAWAPAQPSRVIRVVALAVWWADGEARDDLLRRLATLLAPEAPERPGIVELIQRRTPDLRKFPPTPGVLDLWWAAFSATGDTAFVDLIIDAAPPPGKALEDFTVPVEVLTTRTATWSLTSNAVQHPRVLDRLRARRAAVAGPWVSLDECIASAEEALALEPSPAPPEPPQPEPGDP